MKRKSAVLALCALLGLIICASGAFAEPAAAPVYASAGMHVPTDNDEAYALDWALIGAKPVYGNIKMRFEFDAQTNALKYCFARYPQTLPSGMGIVSMKFGRDLTPAGWLYPSSKSNPVPLYPFALDAVTLRGDGISWRYEKGTFALEAADFSSKDKKHLLNATASWRGCSAYWEKGKSYGTICDMPFKTRIFNLYAGAAFEKGGRNSWFAQNRVNLSKRLAWYSQFDWLDDGSDSASTAWMSGVTYAVSSYNIFRFYYATYDDVAGADKFVIQVSFGSL